MKKELLQLITAYRQSEIAKWHDLSNQGAPQPVGYDFSFAGFCEWLEQEAAV